MEQTVRKTSSGGMHIVNDTPHLFLDEVVDANGEIVSRQCEVRDPSAGKPKTDRPAKKEGCGGCGKKNNLVRMIKGAVAFTKANLGIDAADDDTIDKRLAICQSCQDNNRWHCEDCGCIISEKVRLKSQECPQLKWLVVEKESEDG